MFYSKAWVTFFLLKILTNDNVTSQPQSSFGHTPQREPKMRIIGGHEAVPHSAPYMARIFINKDSSDQSGLLIMCGGSLITSSHIVTAAHCLKGYRSVRYTALGAHNLERDEPERIIVWGGKHAIHEKYNSPINANDIAIIKLPNPVNTSEVISTIDLPSDNDFKKTFVDETAAVYGWGWIHDNPEPVRSNLLMTTNVTVISHEECIRHSAYKTLHTGDLCTSGVPSKGTCHGDSGGPLVLNDTLIGVVSRGASHSCESGDPSIYVNIAHHLQWIKKTMDNL